MSTTTTNYGLVKPAYPDVADISVINSNMDTLDTLIKAKETALTSGWIPITDTWAYASATTITVPSGAVSLYQPGDRIKLTQSSTVKYIIVTAVADTLLTVFGGTDYTLTSATISSIYVSRAKCPFGFPANPQKWTISYSTTSTQGVSAPGTLAWQQAGSAQISVPAGMWRMKLRGPADTIATSASEVGLSAALSTSNNSVSHGELRFKSDIKQATSGTLRLWHTLEVTSVVSLSATAVFYAILSPYASGYSNLQYTCETDNPLILSAECAYL